MSNEYLDIAMEKVIKQEVNAVIDKIRAEIESIERYGTVNGRDIWLRTPEEIKKEVLKIIDKYKADNEIHCNCTDADIAKSFIEDVEAVKDLLPRAESESKE